MEIWLCRQVGIPAKSGVSGSLLVVIPNVMGICTMSPPLDPLGNSCRGVQFCEELVNEFNFHRSVHLLISFSLYFIFNHNNKKKECESGFPYCFLTDFTKFFL